MMSLASRLRAPRALLAVASLLSAAAFAGPAAAATFYVRADGGDASQCTGKADAAYPGSGTNQACAWKHPYNALPPARTPRIAGGDILIVGPGSYKMGIGAPDTAGCSSSTSYDCVMPKIPSGLSATQPTRIVGKGFDGTCSAPPQLWGSDRAHTVFDLRGSSNVMIGCFDVTDRSPCIKGHGGGASCPSTGPWASRGIIAQDSSNVLLRDLKIRGMADKGIHAGRLKDWTMERVTIRANGWVGWDGDIGAGTSSNSGNIVFRESEISWNGCAENYPSTDIHACWGQKTGGYGDGLGTHQTGGNWVFEDTLVHHNTSDGIDLLYMADGGSVTMNRVWAEGNGGNQIKTKGRARIENSVVVGNCAYFEGKFPGMISGDHCRALGNALSVGLFNGSVVDIVNNTISSQGDCLVMSGGGDGSAKLNFANNAMIGEVDYTNTAERSCLHYADNSSAAVTWKKNHVSGVKNNNCPTGSLCGTTAKITNASYAGFDPTPAADSPLLNAADAAVAPSVDYHNHARSTPDIGAVERGGTATTTQPAPAPAPAPTEPTPAPAPAPTGNQVRLAKVTTTSWVQGSRTYYRANAEVVDANGKAVPNVQVSGTWTNAGAGASSAWTNIYGQAKVAGGTTTTANTAAKFCATGISGSGYSFDGRQLCDALGGSGTVASTTPTTEPAPAPAPTGNLVKVLRVTTTSWLQSGRTYYRANAEIVDANGKLMPGATVTGSWTGAGTSTGTAVTNTWGQAKVSGGSTSTANKATFCVTSVTGTNMAFNGVKVCDAN